MIAPFGTTKAGHPVDVITLHAGDLTAKVLTFGAILNDVRLKGVPYGLTLGSHDLAAYDGGPMGYFGALVGPVANRIAGASATLDGQVFTFDANEGATTLHGGAEGIQTEIWQIADHTDRSVTLTLALPDGKGGFPGTRLITAQFEIDAPATLRLRLAKGLGVVGVAAALFDLGFCRFLQVLCHIAHGGTHGPGFTRPALRGRGGVDGGKAKLVLAAHSAASFRVLFSFQAASTVSLNSS